jgi:hypothetical protein
MNHCHIGHHELEKILKNELALRREPIPVVTHYVFSWEQGNTLQVYPFLA